MILKAYKYRIYPNITQQQMLNKTFGCSRFAWNKCVETYNSYNKETNSNPIYKTSTELRQEFTFLKEVSAAAIQQKEMDFKEFKKQKFNSSRKTKLSHPKFKKRGQNDSFRLPNQKFKIIGNKIKLEKITAIKIVFDREIPADAILQSVTISKNSSGQYFASVLVKQKIKQLDKTNKSVGIDVGIKTYCVLSDGSSIENPKYFCNSQTKLKKVQRNLSRKKKCSSRYKKAKLKVARLHLKITNQRDFFLHNITTNIVKNYDIIGVEDLNVKGMVKNRKLSKSISDASFSKFKSMLEYKSIWYGKEMIKVGTFYPSSKTCNSCGNIKKDLTLKDRIYICNSCGIIIDRDVNASLNIEKEALRVLSAIRA